MRLSSCQKKRVVLRDQQYPIFTEELSREEFDRKIRENPANDHLKLKRPLPELPAEEEKRGTADRRSGRRDRD